VFSVSNSQEQLAGASLGGECNVVKLDAEGRWVSLLHYPRLFEEAFPLVPRLYAGSYE